MAVIVNVCVDAMGGDNAPNEIVKGAVEAVCESGKVSVTLMKKLMANGLVQESMLITRVYSM